MKKGYRTILTVCMLLIAYTAVGQQPDKDMDSFPSTEEALSQIGSAAARSPKQPADTAALTSPAQRKGFIRHESSSFVFCDIPALPWGPD